MNFYSIQCMFRNLMMTLICFSSLGFLNKLVLGEKKSTEEIHNPCKQLQFWNVSLPKPLFFVEDNKGARYCCKCQRGTKLLTLCERKYPDSTKCVVCEPGSFMEEEIHTNTNCSLPKPADIDCCDRHFKVLIPGDPKNRPSCHCQSGYFLSKSSCIPFQLCKVNHEVEMQGTPFTDRTCRPCLRGYESKGGTDICVPRLKKSVTVGQTTTPSSQYGMFSTVPIVKLQSDCPSCICNCPASSDWSTGTIVIVCFLCFVLIDALGFGVYYYWHKKHSSSTSSQDSAPVLSSRTHMLDN